MDCDFSPFGDKIAADALSRPCSACGAAVGEPCAGLDGQAFHGARALMARELIRIAETYVEWHRDIPPPPTPPDPPPSLPPLDEGVDLGSILWIVIALLVFAAVVAMIISTISNG